LTQYDVKNFKLISQFLAFSILLTFNMSENSTSLFSQNILYSS